MAFAAKEILLKILSEASVKNISIGKTQLVKLLYLVEVEYCRVNGSRLTDLQWLFYHYGPYALELQAILQEPEFAQIQWETKKGNLYTSMKVAEECPTFGRYMKETTISVLIKKIVGQWAGVPLPELLDYVYFDTEPMIAVQKRGDILDFSTMKKELSTDVIPLKASKETEKQVAELRKRIAPTLKRLSEQRIQGIRRDKDYEEAIKAWNEDVKKGFDPEDLKHINLTITELPDGTGKEGN